MRKYTNKQLRDMELCCECGKKNPTPQYSRCPDCAKRNRERRRENYNYRKKIGVCVKCGKNKAEPRKIMCMECAGRESDRYYEKGGRPETSLIKDSNRKKIMYKERKENNLCPGCGKPVSGYVYCKMCRAKMKNHRVKKKTVMDRSERIQYGLCYICGKKQSMEGKNVCEDCYKVRLEAIKKCNEKRSNDFNKYWKRSNTIVSKAKIV